jgi:hypothetical protein
MAGDTEKAVPRRRCRGTRAAGALRPRRTGAGCPRSTSRSRRTVSAGAVAGESAVQPVLPGTSSGREGEVDLLQGGHDRRHVREQGRVSAEQSHGQAHDAVLDSGTHVLGQRLAGGAPSVERRRGQREEVRRIVDDAHVEVTQLLTDHREQLDGLTHALLEAETLDAPDAYAAAGVPMRTAELEATVTAERCEIWKSPIERVGKRLIWSATGAIAESAPSCSSSSRA